MHAASRGRRIGWRAIRASETGRQPQGRGVASENVESAGVGSRRASTVSKRKGGRAQGPQGGGMGDGGVGTGGRRVEDNGWKRREGGGHPPHDEAPPVRFLREPEPGSALRRRPPVTCEACCEEKQRSRVRGARLGARPGGGQGRAGEGREEAGREKVVRSPVTGRYGKSIQRKGGGSQGVLSRARKQRNATGPYMAMRTTDSNCTVACGRERARVVGPWRSAIGCSSFIFMKGNPERMVVLAPGVGGTIAGCVCEQGLAAGAQGVRRWGAGSSRH